MSPLELHSTTDDLTESLAKVIGYLRTSRYVDLEDRLSTALRGSMGAFQTQLEHHLREEEDVLFPAFRRVSPSSAAELEALTEEHAHLRVLVGELAQAVAAGQHEDATELARMFLAELFNHAERETSLLSGIARSLDEAGLRRLTDLIFHRRVLRVVAEMRPRFSERNARVWVRFAGGRSVEANFWWPEGTDSAAQALRARFLQRLKERVPEIENVEVDHEDFGC